MIVSFNDVKKTFDITELSKEDVVNICSAIDNAPLFFKRQMFSLKSRLEEVLKLDIKHQPSKVNKNVTT